MADTERKSNTSARAGDRLAAALKMASERSWERMSGIPRTKHLVFIPGRTRAAVETRNGLVEKHMRLARYVALRMWLQQMPQKLSLEDMRQDAYVGLVEAVEKNQPERGSFGAFAFRVCWTAVLRGMLRMNPLPQGMIKRRRRWQQAYETCAQCFNREPADYEVADELGVSIEEYHAKWASVGRVPVKVSLFDGLEASDGAEARVALRDEMTTYLEVLKGKNRNIVTLYYLQALNDAEIAEMVGLSRWETTARRRAAIKLLRREFGNNA